MMKKLTVCLITLLLVSSANADITTYFGEDLGVGQYGPWPNALGASNAFQSMLIGVGTENFDGFTHGQSLNGVGIAFGTSGTATFAGNMAIEGNLTQLSVGRFPISGLNYVEGSTSSFTINFDEKVAAFGFYGIDVGDFQGQATVTTVNGGTNIYSIPHTLGSGANGAVSFWGIIDTTNEFTSITISNSGSGIDYFGFDDMTIGTIENVVPVPGAVLLGLLGLSAAGIKLRKFA